MASDDPSTAPRLDRARTVLALADGLGHQLGNLLAANLTALDLLAAGCASAGDRRLLAALEEGTRGAIHAVRQMLRLARGGLAGGQAGCELPYLLADLQRLAAFAFPELAVVTAYPPDLAPLAADPLDVYQLLLDLVGGARAAGAAEVRVGARNLAPGDPAGGLAGPAVAIEVEPGGAGDAGAAARLGGRAEPLAAGGLRVVLPAVPPRRPASLAGAVAELRSAAAEPGGGYRASPISNA